MVKIEQNNYNINILYVVDESWLDYYDDSRSIVCLNNVSDSHWTLHERGMFCPTKYSCKRYNFRIKVGNV